MTVKTLLHLVGLSTAVLSNLAGAQAEDLSLLCAGDKAVECGSAWTFDAPTGMDACSGGSLTIIDLGAVAGGTACAPTSTKTWQITDTCGDTAICSQTVTIVAASPCVPGMAWTARESNRLWHGVASSADGTKLVAVVEDGNGRGQSARGLAHSMTLPRPRGTPRTTRQLRGVRQPSAPFVSLRN